MQCFLILINLQLYIFENACHNRPITNGRQGISLYDIGKFYCLICLNFYWFLFLIFIWVFFVFFHTNRQIMLKIVFSTSSLLFVKYVVKTQDRRSSKDYFYTIVIKEKPFRRSVVDLLVQSLEIWAGNDLLFQGVWGKMYSARARVDASIYIFFFLNSLIRALNITYILNRSIHPTIYRNRKNHLSNSSCKWLR